MWKPEEDTSRQLLGLFLVFHEEDRIPTNEVARVTLIDRNGNEMAKRMPQDNSGRQAKGRPIRAAFFTRQNVIKTRGAGSEVFGGGSRLVAPGYATLCPGVARSSVYMPILAWRGGLCQGDIAHRRGEIKSTRSRVVGRAKLLELASERNEENMGETRCTKEQDNEQTRTNYGEG